jgi:hypothetical protein
MVSSPSKGRFRTCFLGILGEAELLGLCMTPVASLFICGVCPSNFEVPVSCSSPFPYGYNILIPGLNNALTLSFLSTTL